MVIIDKRNCCELQIYTIDSFVPNFLFEYHPFSCHQKWQPWKNQFLLIPVLMYENGIQLSNTEYSRTQKQLQKNYNILQYVNTSHLTKINWILDIYLYSYIDFDIYLDALLLTQEIHENCTQHLFVPCKFFLFFSKHHT